MDAIRNDVEPGSPRADTQRVPVTLIEADPESSDLAEHSNLLDIVEPSHKIESLVERKSIDPTSVEETINLIRQSGGNPEDPYELDTIQEIGMGPVTDDVTGKTVGQSSEGLGNCGQTNAPLSSAETSCVQVSDRDEAFAPEKSVATQSVETRSDQVDYIDSEGESYTVRMTRIAMPTSEIAPTWAPSEPFVKRAAHWRRRQRAKMLAALRRDVEWYIRTQGPATVAELSDVTRFRDLTDNPDDLRLAITSSKCLNIQASGIAPDSDTVVLA